MTTKLTPAKLIESYLALRSAVKDIKERHEKELGQYQTVMAQIENELLHHLDNAGLESFKGEKGTAYKQLSTSVTVSDWEQALKYVRDNQRWELLEARIAKNAALTTIEETGKPVPGIKISQVVVLRVRTA